MKNALIALALALSIVAGFSDFGSTIFSFGNAIPRADHETVFIKRTKAFYDQIAPEPDGVMIPPFRQRARSP